MFSNEFFTVKEICISSRAFNWQATRTIWVLRRMRALGVDQATLVAYWKAEGRVHLELACPVWHSGLTTQQ